MQFDRRWYRNTCNDCLENVSVDVRNENSSKVVVVSVEHWKLGNSAESWAWLFSRFSSENISAKGYFTVSKYLLLEFLQLFPVLKLAFES